MQPLLEVHHLTKLFTVRHGWFGKKQVKKAVDGISFCLKPGEVLGFLGENGAGKTTTIQMLLNLLTPTSGSIHYFGQPFDTHSSAVLRNIGFASSYVRLLSQLTLEENLFFFADLYGVAKAEQPERVKTCLHYFNLWHMRHQKAGTLSSGQSAKLMLAKAFLAKPKIVLLDEPTAALDPRSAHDIRAFVLKQKHEHGTSFLFTSHNMSEVTEVCDRVLVLKEGTIFADNTPEELAASVATATVELFISEHMEAAITFCQEQEIAHAVHGHELSCQVNEQEVAQFLQELTRRGVHYAQIYIKKPQLEDYFLQLHKGAQ